MNIELIVVGKTDMKEVDALVQMYTKRINFYTKFSITYLPDLRNTKNISEQQQKSAEGDMLLKDIANAVAELEKLQYPTPSCIAFRNKEKGKGKVYTH